MFCRATTSKLDIFFNVIQKLIVGRFFLFFIPFQYFRRTVFLDSNRIEIDCFFFFFYIKIINHKRIKDASTFDRIPIFRVIVFLLVFIRVCPLQIFSNIKPLPRLRRQRFFSTKFPPSPNYRHVLR